MRSLWLTMALLVGLASAGSATAEKDPAPEPIGTVISEQTGCVIHQAVLPGDLLDWGTMARRSGPAALALLLQVEVEEEGGESRHQLWQWDFDGEGELAQQGGDLPEDVVAILPVESSSSDTTEVVVATSSGWLRLDENGRWQEQPGRPREIFSVPTTRDGRVGFVDQVVGRGIGSLESWEWVASQRELVPKWSVELPIAVERVWGGLRLTSPAVRMLEGIDGSTPLYTVGPEPQGAHRFRSWVIVPSANGAVDVEEYWNLLPEPEQIEESWFVRFNGNPALIVTTLLADKHGIFEKKKIRLFSLTTDRTRSGSGPLLASITRSRNWYATCAGITDLNGDGLDDVVSAQPKGLGAGSLWVEGYLGAADGGFEERTRSSELEVEEGEICTLAVDVSGDGEIDLVVLEETGLQVFEIERSTDSAETIATQPRWRVDLERLYGRPMAVDLFPDAAPQLLIGGRTEGGRHVLRVLRFR